MAAQFESLRRLSASYALWSQGFYRDAQQELRTLQTPPQIETVELLAQVWPGRKEPAKAILAALTEDKVFADSVTGLAYFLDVLVWNDEAACRSRPRETFLRLYGAAESVVFYVFETYVGRQPEVLKIDCEAPEALEPLQSSFATNRQGESIDWHREVHQAAMGFFRISSLGALRVLTRGSSQFEPQIDLAKLLGKEAEDARSLIPKIRAHMENPPIGRGLYNRLVDSKRGGLGRYSNLRNKAVHWMAPVPAEMTLELLSFFRKLLREMLPPSVEALKQSLSDEEGKRLDRWTTTLQQAAEIGPSAAFSPLDYREAVELLGARDWH